MKKDRSILPKYQEKRFVQEPGTAMFKRLRMRLTLWYSAVLASALLLFCIALYLGVQHTLLDAVDNQLIAGTQPLALQWQSLPALTCTLPPFAPGSLPLSQASNNKQFSLPFMMACFDNNGLLLQQGGNEPIPQTFLTNNLAKNALQMGDKEDTVNADTSSGHIRRYARTIYASGSHAILGVIQVGISINTQETTLNTLLSLLLILGTILLFGAGLGGLFLANRALVPARLAFTRQQRFIADASHELRTPLTLLSADAEMLLRVRDRLEAEDALLLEDIFTEATHMTTLATSMLALARLDAGAAYAKQEHDLVNLSVIAEQVVRRSAALARQRSITLRVENPASAFIIGDADLLEQATLILLDNAIKYNRQQGHVTVRTYVKDREAFLEVIDTGVGITQEHLSHLGERFYRVDKARSREMGGTGLGLSIAHSIAITQHGALKLVSMTEQGTTATLKFPTARSVLQDK